ncbi:helix-turn-helix domain-containing protein [Spongiibacter sp.]|uniref:winged helix-turn-helix transcriptional regulator n=1 Tax=Spongiibacter sp. TaxID=2024860 RepID=UPI001B2C96C5|nr:helix-turn-helix domain-containing protein [Spongiibacter sp.]MBO6753329.1 helix-turn-helix transcriptional regulator [Spongiibacter sp.]|tara:strand:- start:1856 stop:2239 length:384 start_codon:yes stop_codon:yes gene_type:complete
MERATFTPGVAFPDDDSCPVRDVLSPITSKWPMLILFALLDGPQRFSVLQRRIENISRKMLTSSLRMLERDGFIRRQAYPEVPPRVEYELTTLGRKLASPLVRLVEWTLDNHDEVKAARRRFDTSAP